MNASPTDQEQLRLLEIFHYIVGGITALFSLFPLIHVAFGVAMITGGFGPQKPEEPPIELFGGFIVAIGLLFVLFGEVLAFCMILAGRKLAKRIGYTFVFVIACIECLFMPFGTALGVCTIIVLQRESVKRLFGRATPPTMPPIPQ